MEFPDDTAQQARDTPQEVGGEVGVVGLVAGVGGLAELFSSKGVDDTGLEAGGGERLDGLSGQRPGAHRQGFPVDRADRLRATAHPGGGPGDDSHRRLLAGQCAIGTPWRGQASNSSSER